jgi:signal transduction histidine kinase
MKINEHIRLSLRLKVALTAVVGVVLLAAVLVYFYGHEMTRTADEAMDKRAGAVATGLANECEYGLLIGNNSLVQQAVVKVLAQPDVLSAVVFNDEGKVVATAGPVDIAAKAKAGAELVATYNQASIVETHVTALQQADVFYVRVFSQPFPASSDFNVDESSQGVSRQTGQKLGLIELTISHSSTDMAVEQSRRSALLIASLLVAVISVICVLAVRRAVRPLRTLVQGTKELASGNLSARVKIVSPDEIGELARAFNKMAESLERSSDELEFRVKERTAELAESNEALTERVRLSALSADMGSVLTRSGDQRGMLQGCSEAMVKHLDAAFARIWTLNEAENVLELQSSAGMYTHIDGGHARVPVGKFKIGLIAQERQPHLTNAVIGDPRVPEQEWAKREGLVAFAGYPLIVADRLVGVMAMFARQPLTEATHQALASVADMVAIGIERTRAEKEVRQLNAELEARVRERTAQLEATNKELESFSYSVSHDLRTPLLTIDGFSQALLEDYADKLDATGQNYLQRVRTNAQHMSELIDDLLGLARLARSEIQREPVDLSALARAIAADLQRKQPERRVECTVADGLTAHADPRQMRALLENLLGNAWKYSSKQPQARIEFGRCGSNGTQAFFVRDNGAGFDMAHATKLFGAFQRLHTEDEFPGSGIGLANVQRIVHRHGGRVWAEGAVGKGATFYFTL